MEPKIVNCFVITPDGSQKVELFKGPDYYFQHPDWRCSNIKCPMYETNRQSGTMPEVRLGNYDGKHGVIRCGGGAERK